MVRFHCVVSFLLSFVSCCCLELDYTEEAFTLDGEPCMSNCVNRKCVINLGLEEKLCKPGGIPAPIYFTSQKKYPYNDRCLSNCGTFGYSYEWCFTTERYHWDYCNTNGRQHFPRQAQETASTTRRQHCYGENKYCLNKMQTYYYWCDKDIHRNWDYCAPAPESRIPILATDFRDNLNTDLYNWFNLSNCSTCKHVSYAKLNYFESIIKVIQEDYTSLIKTIYDPFGPLSKYKLTIVDLPHRLSVPIAIKLYTSNGNLKGPLDLATLIRKHLKEMTLPQNFEFDEKADFNNIDFITSTPLFDTPVWLQAEQKLNDWFKSNYSFELLIVIFYSRSIDPVPEAIGLLVLKNYHAYPYRGIVFFNGPMP